MKILEMITEWRKGCSCGPHNPANCPDCTAALIDAIEVKLRNPQGGNCGFLVGAMGGGGGIGVGGGGGVIYNGCPVSSGGSGDC